MKHITQTIEIPNFEGFVCIGHGKPKKGQYYIFSANLLHEAPFDFQTFFGLIYEKIDIAKEVTDDAVSKIQEFPGYVFDRIGTPKEDEFFIGTDGSIRGLGMNILHDKNYVIYRKELTPTKLNFIPLKNFVDRKLKLNEVLIVQNNSNFNFNFYWPPVWDVIAKSSTENKYACLITFTKETTNV